MKIANELFDILNKRKDGVGLAANQVGIDAQVAVVNVREPLILINPKYIEKGNEIPYFEGCLSFQGKGVNTKRYDSVVIKTAQEDSNWYFSSAPNPSDGKSGWDKQQRNKNDQELRLLETVCIQHEIDHLNGMTIMDRQMVTTITTETKIGRNDPCHCGSGKKYKKCCL
tara:strand:- start:322 stop:828 length:507 start_codon:yes stop_codon:yes gene_type:complete